MVEITKSVPLPLDEYRLLERMYPSIGEKTITIWTKQRRTVEDGQYTRYIGQVDWRPGCQLIVDVRRGG